MQKIISHGQPRNLKINCLAAFLMLDSMKDLVSAGTNQPYITKNYCINLLLTSSLSYGVMKLFINDVDPIQNPTTVP